MDHPFVIWNEKYETGIHDIDDQHKNLVTLINKLYEGLTNSRKLRNESFIEATVEIVLYIKDHFSWEEEFMISTGYPGLEAQKKEHGIFYKKIDKGQRKFCGRGLAGPQPLCPISSGLAVKPYCCF